MGHNDVIKPFLAGDSGVTADFEVDFENAFANQPKVDRFQRQNTFDLASLNSSLSETQHGELPTKIRLSTFFTQNCPVFSIPSHQLLLQFKHRKF